VNEKREGRIFVRGKRLWIAWYDRDGIEQRETCRAEDTPKGRKTAERILREKLNEKGREEAHVRGAKRLTVGELLAMLADYHQSPLKNTKSWPRLRQHAEHLREHFGDEARVSRIDYAALEAYAAKRLRVAMPATVHNELALLRQAFRIARQRKGFGASPEFPRVTVRNTRTVTFTDEQLTELLKHLPPAVAAATRFASWTGWRLMECLDLRWERLDFAAGTIRIEANESKTGEPRTWPFRRLPALAALLEQQRDERWRIERKRGITVEHVFTREGRAIRNFDDAWKAGCKKAGLVDEHKKPTHHFHDLRRYAGARLRAAGVSAVECMLLMGHKTLSMHVRYGLADTHALSSAVEKLAALDAAAPVETKR
jgi:integrase